ncbi:Fe-S cluster assembly ATPase SufC [Sulfurimonas sp. MAG313]|nr:Fe-S cluster assembly ATPase SufC [Sulfurimonas sp. MAG313]MDF1881864.1 Fe-S cluster assembly ATPase SufC [Sulfurimonas sp. MAG313]
MLKMKDLEVTIGNKDVIKGLNLDVRRGEVHVIMGLNGTGKSTLLKAISGSYETKSKGKIEFLNEDISSLSADERAIKGIFMSFQNPIEIPGVNTIYFLKTALNEQKKARNEELISSPLFMKELQEKMEFLHIDKEILHRNVNVGFSGGEKKKSEVLQMMILKPKLILLDEIDSGLDIDALKSVAKGINSLLTPETSIIIVTHYNRLLEYIKADFVHILNEGKIVKTAGASLAKELEDKGYKHVLPST